MSDETVTSLRRGDLDASPFRQFERWYREFCARGFSVEPAAMQLATFSESGTVSVRTVLLKAHDESGFVFYTNRMSAKGRAIAHHRRVGLHFFWVWMDRQIRIEGTAQDVPDAEADSYFASRPRASRIGAWTSEQSRVLGSRDDLEAEYARYEREFAGRDIARPPHWGGYRVVPDRIEFWQGQKARLHDRFVYGHKDGDWVIERLAP